MPILYPYNPASSAKVNFSSYFGFQEGKEKKKITVKMSHLILLELLAEWAEFPLFSSLG